MSSTVNVCLMNGGGLGRIRLCRPTLFARHLGLRNRTFFDRPDGVACHAVEHVEPAGLAGHDDDVPVAPVVTDRRQLRRGARVHVPQVVMHESGNATGACPCAHQAQRSTCRRDWRRSGRHRRSRRSAIRAGCKRCRVRVSIVISPQLLVPPMYFQASFGQVS